jgi:hypothetical protein
MVMGATKKDFEEVKEEKITLNEFYNTARVHRGNQAFKNIINLVNMFPNNADLGQKVREYVASRDNE